MPMAQVGMKVQVNMDGFQAPGVSMSGGVFISGTIVSIGLNAITVQLDVVISGQNMVTVTPDRVTALA